jgi:Cytochrome c oxidase subunit IIa family
MENPQAEKIQEPILNDEVKQEEKFFPSGAIVFFILLVLLCLAFWYGIYFLMIQRA